MLLRTVFSQFFIAKCFKMSFFKKTIIDAKTVLLMFSMRYHTISGTPQNLVISRVSREITLRLRRGQGCVLSDLFTSFSLILEFIVLLSFHCPQFFFSLVFPEFLNLSFYQHFPVHSFVVLIIYNQLMSRLVSQLVQQLVTDEEPYNQFMDILLINHYYYQAV